MLNLMRSLLYFRRYDAVMIYCPVMSAVAYGAVRKLFYREPMWLNIQDIPADAAAASGISRNPLTKAFGNIVQSVLFNRADVFSTIAPKMVERVSSLRRRGQPVYFVPNYLNGSMAEAIGANPTKLGRAASRPLKLLYAGNIGKKQGLLEFCERLKTIDLDFTFRIHGDGGEAHAIRQWIQSQNDPRFQFGEFLDERGFVAALFDADIFVITEKPGVGASFIPSKLIPCIATGTPVLSICDVEGPLGQEVRQHDLGVVLEWEQFGELPAALARLAVDPERLGTLQKNALDRARTYGRGPIIDLVEKELQRLASGKPAAAAMTHAQAVASTPELN
jgi:colanic acid biosynthesis glycosyl transferase WcaI